MNRKSLS